MQTATAPDIDRSFNVRLIPIEQLAGSATNPRTHFDDAYIADLAGSIKEKGLLQPIVVRERVATKEQTRYEIVAGECRYRASKVAGLPTVPSIVRDYTDEQVLELQLIENIHRQDLTPLEQAVGYRRLITMDPDKHSAETIARKVGMSVAWVWDRLKLNDLIPDAKQLLERERISVGHAIVLARLKPEDQQRVIKPGRRDGYNADASSGLWVRESTGLTFGERPEKTEDPYDGLKPKSIRELEGWIADHIRFDVEHAAKAAPLEFEPIAEQVQQAQAQPGRGKKVIAITFDHHVHPDAKGDERTYGPKSWRFADGEKHADQNGYGSHAVKVWPTCEHAVLGVVVAGTQFYQRTFDVCIARDKCDVHFGKEIREKQKTQKLRESGQTAQANKREADARERERKEREQEERRAARWRKLGPALKKAVLAKTASATAVTGQSYAFVLDAHRLPANTKPADLLVVMFRQAVKNKWNYIDYVGYEQDLVANAKLLGVDVDAVRREALGEETSDKTASAKKAAKTPGKKR